MNQNSQPSNAFKLSARALEIRDDNHRNAFAVTSEHRMELVKTIEGVTWINDSKATNIASTWHALHEIPAPVILIMGGVDKGNEYSILLSLVKEKVRFIVCLGLYNKKIVAFFKYAAEVIETYSMQECVQKCARIAQKGDTVLLSPACASFDLFDNYEDRGRQFKEEVRKF